MRIIRHNGYGAETPPYEFRKQKWTFKPYTIVFEGIPETAEAIGLASRFLEGEVVSITVNVGVARCHPKDDFCRKTGLQTANAKIKALTAQVKQVTVMPGGQLDLWFETAEGGFHLFYKPGHRAKLAHDSIG